MGTRNLFYFDVNKRSFEGHNNCYASYCVYIEMFDNGLNNIKHRQKNTSLTILKYY